MHKAPVDDLGEAFLAGTTQGNIYSDVVGSDTSTWYYWARVVKQVGDLTIIGPWNQTQGTPANDGDEEPPDTSPPEPLKNLEARGGMTAIRVLWDPTEYSYYYRVEVHKASVDDLGEAFLAGTTQGNIYSDVVGSDTSTWYYWARVVKQVGSITIIGPWNQTQGTPAAAAPDPDWILEDIEGKIGDSHLNDALSSEIEKIPRLEIDIGDLETGLHTETEERKDEDEQLHSRIETNVSRIDDNTAAIITESETRATEDEALARMIDTLAVEVEGNTAAIQVESEVRASEDEALASRITDVQVDFDDKFGAIRDEMNVIISDQEAIAERVGTVELDLEDTKGAIEQRFTVVEDELGQIRAEYTVKLDVCDEDGNCYAGGFGLVNDGDTIMALWRVDTFAIGSPGEESLAFAVDDGRTVMDGAYIKDATINTAQIGSLDVEKLTGDTATFVNANIVDGSITNAKIGNVINSEGYTPGKKGWIINKSGFAEFSDIVARGKIEGSIIRGSVIEGGMLIQSDIQITTPTEADLGAGTIRYLSVATIREQVATFEGDSEVSAESRVLGIVSANYTAEGYDEYGDGDLKEPVYNNLNRYLKYTIKPVLFAHAKIKHVQDGRYDIGYRFKVIAVGYDNSETDIYTGDWFEVRVTSGGWNEGSSPDGEWRAYVHTWQSCGGDDNSCKNYSGVSEMEATVTKRSFSFKSSKYKGFKAWFEFKSRATPYVQTVSVKDTLSNYL